MDEVAFGRYRLIELLGRGGMGEVWRAHDTAANNRTVAIKLLPPHLAGDATFVVRFRREADAAAQLNNPHIIPIHNYGEIDGRLYVDMRLIEGRDLQQVLADGPLEPGRAVRIIEGVAKALHAAHEVGLVHRDVKPSNILLDRDDFAYLIDFGIARGVDETGLTGTGGVIGSWHYMSPERLQAGQVDARADIYALACVLYECLTGNPPYPGDNVEQQITAHLTAPPPQPSTSQPNIPKQVDQVIATGMAKDPDQRYATTVELASAAHDAITTPIPRPAQNLRTPPSEPTLLDDRGPITPATEPAARQQPADLNLAATQHRPPGRPPLAKEKLDERGQPLGALPREAYTSWIRRVGAAIIDAIPWMLFWGFNVVYHTVYVATCHANGFTDCDPSLLLRSVLQGTEDVLLLVYAIWNWGYRQGTTGSTIGKSVLKFTVVSQRTGQPIGFGRSIVRQLAHVVDAIICCVGFLFPLWDAKRRTLADMIMSTVCLATPTPQPRADIRRKVKVGLIPAVVVVLAAAGITGYLSPPASRLSPPASRQVTLPFTDLNQPVGVAVDSAGDLYVNDMSNNRVLELAAGSSTPTVLPFTGLYQPLGVAVDSAGNVYVADPTNNRVLKLAAGSSTPTVLPFAALNFPGDVAVDSAGNLYVTDGLNLGRVVKLAAGSATQSVLPFTGLDHPSSSAVDSAGNVYVTDGGNSRVLKLAAGSATQTVLPFTGLNDPGGVAVDSAGNLYVTDTFNSRVVELAAGSATQSVLPFTGLDHPDGVAVDSAGNVYVVDHNNNRVLKLPAG